MAKKIVYSLRLSDRCAKDPTNEIALWLKSLTKDEYEQLVLLELARIGHTRSRQWGLAEDTVGVTKDAIEEYGGNREWWLWIHLCENKKRAKYGPPV